jgi:hypothetical protein
MALVSNFTIGKVSDRTTRYRLQVTNLEQIPIEFLFEAHLALGEDDDIGLVADSLSVRGYHFREGVPPEPRSESLGDVRGSVARATLRAFTRIWLPPDASGLVSLEYAGGGGGSDAPAELSGYATLRVPAARLRGRFELFPQSEGNVRVLLHASHVSYRPQKSWGFTDTEGRVIGHQAGLDDADAEAIALASGKAENEIAAEGWRLEGVSDFLERLHDGDVAVEGFVGARDLQDEDRAPALLDLLAGIAEDHDGISALNAYLDRSGSRLRLEAHD